MRIIRHYSYNKLLLLFVCVYIGNRGETTPYAEYGLINALDHFYIY